MTITPDTKDWTWVLRHPCDECGFDSRTLPREQIPTLLRGNVAEWPAVLAGSEDPRRRPRPDKWSPLEYACHVRDVFRLYDQRLRLMLTSDGPTFPNWDQDATAVAERYGEQDPATVAAELVEAGERLAASFAAVSGAAAASGSAAGLAWDRTGFRSDGAHFTVESFGRYLVHDPIHHLYDVTGRRAG